MRFPLDGKARRLAPFAPLLRELGLKAREELPQEPLPLDAAVATLAGVIISRHHRRWWRAHDVEGEAGWAAIGHPIPTLAAYSLVIAHELLTRTTPSAVYVEAMRKLGSQLALTSTMRLEMLAAAEECRCGTATLNATTEIEQIGLGAKGIHFVRSGSERDTFTGYLLEENKHVTVDTLRRFGIPAAKGAIVWQASNVARAVAKVGLPCVVKPLELNRGVGVTTRLASGEQVAAAVAEVHKLHGRPVPVLIEKQVEGDDHRIMVAQGRLLWVYRRTPASVVGDGEATVRQLIERENERRAGMADGPDAFLHEIGLGEELSRLLRDRHDITPDHILEKGRRIEVIGQANTARGGLREDVTGITHPDNRALALRVARLFRLGTAGIDFITPDISRSWKEVDCAVIEVNRVPSFWGAGDGTLLFRSHFPNRRSGRVPVVLIIGSAEWRATLSRTVERAFQRHGLQVASADHVEERIRRGEVLGSRHPTAIETAMLDRDAEALLFRCDPALVDQSGTPLSVCDLLLVEDETPRPWLAGTGGVVLSGATARTEAEQAIEKLVHLYADPEEGGPLPVIEEVASHSEGEFWLKAWRAPAVPREAFWNELGLPLPAPFGLTTTADLFAAVHALARQELGDRGNALGPLTHDDYAGPWFRATFEARIPLAGPHQDAARAALSKAIERANQVATIKIP